MYYQTIVRNNRPKNRFSWRIPVQLLLVSTITCFTASALRGADGGLGNGNTAEGLFALNAIATNSANTGTDNTAMGTFALGADTSGSFNTASGENALGLNTTGSHNTATGFDALFNNNADNNTATGFKALFRNTTGTGNTASGYFALFNNDAGSDNTATGFNALLNNTTGNSNTADGLQALADNMDGSNNTALGFNALVQNVGGNNNTASGFNALATNKTGNGNTAMGFQALVNSTGSNNIALGNNAGLNITSGSNDIYIGNAGKTTESNTIRIGTQGTQKATFVAGIAGAPVTGSTVVVSSAGKLGVATSSARFKEAIKPMDRASEAVLALKPVTFRYKEEVDPDRAPQFGLVAEEVEKVDRQLVVHDEEGKPFTVRYEAVNAMLLNEFLKEHRRVADLEKKAVEQDKLKATVAAQQTQIETLAAMVQKVAANSN